MTEIRKEMVLRLVGEVVIKIAPGERAQYEHMTSEGKLVWRLLSLVPPTMREKMARQLTDSEVQTVADLLSPGDGKHHDMRMDPDIASAFEEAIKRRFAS